MFTLLTSFLLLFITLKAQTIDFTLCAYTNNDTNTVQVYDTAMNSTNMAGLIFEDGDGFYIFVQEQGYGGCVENYCWCLTMDDPTLNATCLAYTGMETDDEETIDEADWIPNTDHPQAEGIEEIEVLVGDQVCERNTKSNAYTNNIFVALNFMIFATLLTIFKN